MKSQPDSTSAPRVDGRGKPGHADRLELRRQAIPLALLAWLVLIAYLLPSARPEELGSWFPRGNRLAQATAGIIAALLLVLTLLAVFQAAPV